MHPFRPVYDKSNNERVLEFHVVLILVEEEVQKRKKLWEIRGRRGAERGRKLDSSPRLCDGVHRHSG